MQYFQALKLGQKRVAQSREYLNKLTDGKAMPALALTDTKSNVWEPVGEKNLYAFVDESAGFVLTDNSGFILALVDKNGASKTIVQGVTKEQKENLEKSFIADKIPKFEHMTLRKSCVQLESSLYLKNVLSFFKCPS